MDSYMHNRPSSAMKMKVSTTRKMVEDEEDDMEEEEEEEGGGGGNQGHEFGGVEYNLKKTKLSGVGVGVGVCVAGEKGFSGGGGGVATAVCQVEKCGADLNDAKKYHKRHKVCEVHAKAAVVIVAGSRQRFCQQCSRFHVVSEFDEAKRSCRRRLAGHNERRRKSSSECRGEGSNRRGSNQFLKENQFHTS